MSNFHTPARLLKLKHVQALTTLSKTSIYNMMGEGTFPKSVRLGPKAVAWREDDVVDWINSRPLTQEAEQ